MIKDRVTVQEAARGLGVKDDAIRKRIQRGTSDYEKNPDGRVYGYLDETEDGQEADAFRSTQDTSCDALVAAKDETIRLLGEQLEERESRRRADTLIAQLMQTNATLASRVPELEAASTDPPDSLGSSSATDEAQSAADHRS
jgi:predicted ArsR family transcriptional regulator